MDYKYRVVGKDGRVYNGTVEADMFSTALKMAQKASGLTFSESIESVTLEAIERTYLITLTESERRAVLARLSLGAADNTLALLLNDVERKIRNAARS